MILQMNQIYQTQSSIQNQNAINPAARVKATTMITSHYNYQQPIQLKKQGGVYDHSKSLKAMPLTFSTASNTTTNSLTNKLIYSSKFNKSSMTLSTSAATSTAKYKLPRLPNNSINNTTNSTHTSKSTNSNYASCVKANNDCDELTNKINELIKKYDQININYINNLNKINKKSPTYKSSCMNTNSNIISNINNIINNNTKPKINSNLFKPIKKDSKSFIIRN
jgi:hypothetical protein